MKDSYHTIRGQQLQAVEVWMAMAVDTQYQDTARRSRAKTWRNVVEQGDGRRGVPVSGRYAFG
jgi:hypothetical protein